MGRVMEKRRTIERRALVAKALLLGYTIEEYRLEEPGPKARYVLGLPDGQFFSPGFEVGTTRVRLRPNLYHARHLAALAALKHAGVIREKKSLGDARTHSRKGDRLHKRTRK